MAGSSLVSILIPNYNYRRFLPERFSSILAQSYPNTEILFLDDASRDGSLDFVRSIATKIPLRILGSPTNEGTFRQWQRGVEQARGEFVWIAEADDSCAPNLLEELVTLAKRFPSTGFVYAQSLIIDERGGILKNAPRYLQEIDPARWGQDHFARGEDEVSNYLILRNTVPNASACLFRREALGGIDLAEMSLQLCGDWLAYAQILRRHDIGFLAKPLNFYRKHKKTLRASSDRSARRIQESYAVQQFIAKRFEITPEMHEMASRFTFREWMHLQRSGALPADFQPSPPALKTCAETFDPAIARRFDREEAQALPSLLVQQRSWRAALRWQSSWYGYRDDRRVTMRVGPCRGEVRIDPLSKIGHVTIERLSFFPPNSPDAIMVAAASELGTFFECRAPTAGTANGCHGLSSGAR